MAAALDLREVLTYNQEVIPAADCPMKTFLGASVNDHNLYKAKGSLHVLQQTSNLRDDGGRGGGGCRAASGKPRNAKKQHQSPATSRQFQGL